jgi:hypothetical protein
MNEENLKKEAKQATEMLRGKIVCVVWRPRSKEVGLEFTDGTRLFVDCATDGAELSITDGQDSQTTQNDARPEGEVIVKLTQAEALVLFEFCSRFIQEDVLSIEDQAEERVLWNLTAVLEKMLLEPFLPDYSERVAEAREKLRDKG